MKTSREIRDFVLGFFQDWSDSDVHSLIDFFSLSEGTVYIGTDPAEYWVGGRQIRAIFRKQLEELGPVKLEAGKIVAFEEGTVGWAAVPWVATLQDGTVMNCRSTGVYHREEGQWRTVQSHTSIGISNPEAIGFEITTSIDEVAELVERERPHVGPVTSPEGTVTIMFTDLEASTATNEAIGDDSFLPLLLKHNEIVRALTQSLGGSVVKSQGDGFMLAFPSARRAVDCASAIQRDVSALDDRLKVRVGIHTGEPVRHVDDFYGRDVAYAARIGSAAAGGEILVSPLVKSLVEPSGSVTFDEPRKLELKGFDGLQSVYAVRWSEGLRSET